MVTIRDIKTICTAPEGINLLVVKVETSEPGLYGLGCGTFAYRHLAVKLVVEEYLRPLLIGRDVSDINDIWQLMHQNGYWRNGPIENNAISGVDMALWDIKGKMANMPLYQLFGGKCREGVPVYRHVDGRDLSEICENIAKYREIGVKTIRCQCGGYGGSEYGHTPAGAPVGAKPACIWTAMPTSVIPSNCSTASAARWAMRSAWCTMCTSASLRPMPFVWPRSWSPTT